MGLPCPQSSRIITELTTGDFLGGKVFTLTLKESGQLMGTERCSRVCSSVSGDLEGKICRADSRTVRSGARGDRCPGKQRETKWEWAGVHKVRPIPTLYSLVD